MTAPVEDNLDILLNENKQTNKIKTKKKESAGGLKSLSILFHPHRNLFTS